MHEPRVRFTAATSLLLPLIRARIPVKSYSRQLLATLKLFKYRIGGLSSLSPLTRDPVRGKLDPRLLRVDEEYNLPREDMFVTRWMFVGTPPCVLLPDLAASSVSPTALSPETPC
ncbi:hypothetical protein KCU83_g457, partial [Aureobasidium melanogenum]